VITQLIASWLMLSALFRIRKFVNENKDKVEIDTRNMLLHAFALGLAALSELMLFVIFFFPNTTTIYVLDTVLVSFFTYISFFLMVIILWKLGSKEDDQMQAALQISSEEEFVEVMLKSYDEEAQVQARLWRLLVRMSRPQGTITAASGN
jgi:hypothetical protein